MAILDFYTNCRVAGDFLLYRGVRDGKRIRERIPYKPTLFLPSNEESKFKTLHGQYLKPMEFESIKEARYFIDRYKDIENFHVYGNTNFNYCYISDLFPGTVEYDSSKLVLMNLDIETMSENGFPDPDVAAEPILSIATKIKNKYVVFGWYGDFESDDSDLLYIKCDSEVDLLKRFIDTWVKLSPDAVVGYNITYFDMPYLITRITKILGESEAQRLSPWGFFSERTVTILGKVTRTFGIAGVSFFDYIELYKKYAPNFRQESYKLDHIANVELGEQKLIEDGYKLYKTDYKKFIEYNKKDVELVDKLDKKLKLIDLVLTIAYDAKVNYDDVLGQIRVWDNIIFNELRSRNIVVPPKGEVIEKLEKFRGAHVEEPKIGLHKWVGCFDVTSLYPNLIRSLNISPETLLPDSFVSVIVDDLLNRKLDTEYLKTDDMNLAANGHCFRTDIDGILPEVTTRILTERQTYKKKMLESKQLLEEIQREIKHRGL